MGDLLKASVYTGPAVIKVGPAHRDRSMNAGVPVVFSGGDLIEDTQSNAIKSRETLWLCWKLTPPSSLSVSVE